MEKTYFVDGLKIKVEYDTKKLQEDWDNQYDISELAKKLNIPVSTILGWIKNGFPYFVFCSRYMFDLREVIKWLKQKHKRKGVVRVTLLQARNNKLKSNPNIVHRNGQKPRVFKNVKHLHCIGCDAVFSFDTDKTIYWFNAHGWVICDKCINKYKGEGVR